MSDNLKPFRPGPDPRRNTKGRPKSFKQLRALIVSIAQEPIKDGDERTRIEDMIRRMLRSDNPSDRALSLKYGWGNVPEQLEVKGEVKYKIKLKKHESDNRD